MPIQILMPAIAGFAVFLCGMKLMELAMLRLAGAGLHGVLSRSTDTPVRGLLTGAAASAVMQSSTAVTVLTISLANAGLLTKGRTLGIVLGTNIGTCLTTELLGLPVARAAGPLCAASAAVWALTVLLMEYRPAAGGGRGTTLPAVHFGAVAVFGFALLLKGIALMQSVAPAVQQSGMFAWFLARSADGPLWGLAAGAVLTAAAHSSAAVIGLIMGLAGAGALPATTGIAAVLGANVGTCFTALAAAIPGSSAGRFVAWAHLALNAAGALLFAPLIGQLHSLSALLSADPAAQIAHAQTLFNVLCSLLALPLCYLPPLRASRRDGGGGAGPPLPES